LRCAAFALALALLCFALISSSLSPSPSSAVPLARVSNWCRRRKKDSFPLPSALLPPHLRKEKKKSSPPISASLVGSCFSPQPTPVSPAAGCYFLQPPRPEAAFGPAIDILSTLKTLLAASRRYQRASPSSSLPCEKSTKAACSSSLAVWHRCRNLLKCPQGHLACCRF
ncbi:hypothetical protein ASPBRDRAFT_147569, partial [Aspergillus brasiliensis CBS 101740]